MTVGTDSEMAPRAKLIPSFRARIADKLSGTPFGIKQYIPSGFYDNKNCIVTTGMLPENSTYPQWHINLRNVPDSLDNGAYPNMVIVNPGDHLPGAPTNMSLWVQFRLKMWTRSWHEETAANAWLGSSQLTLRPMMSLGGSIEASTWNTGTNFLEIPVGPDQTIDIQLNTDAYCAGRLLVEVIGWKLLR